MGKTSGLSTYLSGSLIMLIIYTLVLPPTCDDRVACCAHCPRIQLYTGTDWQPSGPAVTLSVYQHSACHTTHLDWWAVMVSEYLWVLYLTTKKRLACRCTLYSGVVAYFCRESFHFCLVLTFGVVSVGGVFHQYRISKFTFLGLGGMMLDWCTAMWQYQKAIVQKWVPYLQRYLGLFNAIPDTNHLR